MNNAAFIKLLQDDDEFRKRVRRHVVNEMQSAAARESITLGEMPMDDLEKLSVAFVERGLHEKP